MKKITLTIFIILFCLGSIYGHQSVIASEVSFKDILNSHWANNVIQEVVKDGVVNGYADGTFRPNNQIKENEFYAMLLRSFDKSLSNANSGNWADNYYEFAAQMNYPTNTKRTEVLTRTRVAEIIVGIQGFNYSGDDAIQFMIATGLSNGKKSDTIKGYDGLSKLTRAESVAFIANVKKTLGADFKLKIRPTAPSSKQELPKIQIKQENIVGLRDAKLETQAIEANQVASKYEMYVGYNSNYSRITLKASDGYYIMAYDDLRASDGAIVVKAAHLLKDSGVIEERVLAVVEVLTVLGLQVDTKLNEAIIRVLTSMSETEIVNYSDFNVKIHYANYGSVGIFID